MRIVRETGKPIAQVARDLGINEGTLGSWIAWDTVERGEADGLDETRGSDLSHPRPCQRGVTDPHPVERELRILGKPWGL